MTAAEHHSTAADGRIPWNRLIAHGFGGLIPIAPWLLRLDPPSEKRACEIKAISEERMVAKEGGER